MRKILSCALLYAAFLLLPLSANAFTCMANGVAISTSANVNVYVTLQPQLEPNQNLVVNLGDSIKCKNDLPQYYKDPIRVGTSSAYGGALANFNGSMKYYGVSYPFPTTTATAYVDHTWSTYQPWQTVLYLNATGAAGGVVIEAGSLIATLRLEKGGSDVQVITWNIYAANSVIVPTGGCDVSSRDVNITLPDYPGMAEVPLRVHCAKNQNLSYFLSGTTVDTARTIIKNTASASPAEGVGIQLSNASGILPMQNNISLGSVGTSPVSLGLKAQYARTGPQVVAGNVQSVVEVTFVYE